VRPASAPLRNDLPWRFCARCGQPMAWIRTADSYDRATGTYGENWAWRCPRWAPGDHTKSHDAANVTVRG
jgi:hypothetical protein